MKVLFVSNDPTIFDPMSAARERMRAYARSIGELHIISEGTPTARAEKDEMLFLHPIRTWKLLRIATLARRAHALVLEHSIEVISAQDPFEHGLAAMRASQGTNAKLHIQIHTDFLSPWFIRNESWRKVHTALLNRYRRHIAEQVLTRADGIRVVSERIRASLIEQYGSRIVDPVIIPVMVDAAVPEPTQLPAHPDFTFSFIAVGRLEPEKRFEDILAALAIAAAQYPAIGLFIIGEGRERTRLKRMARSFGLSSKVIFLGNQPNARAFMGSAQAFIQASAYEGYGRTLIEAALAKIPIITTDAGIVGDVFRNHKEVLAVPVADPTALSLAVVDLIRDTAVREELASRAEAAARAHLDSAGTIPLRIAQDLKETLSRQ
jgi:glycosyltransferase involved in cell wall biosynthesis